MAESGATKVSIFDDVLFIAQLGHEGVEALACHSQAKAWVLECRGEAEARKVRRDDMEWGECVSFGGLVNRSVMASTSTNKPGELWM